MLSSLSLSIGLVVILHSTGTLLALNDNPLLLLISMDGFRYDLLNATLVPNIWRFAQQGVHFKNGSESQYLTYTMPNHASLSTGLLVQHHGIVGNSFIDPATGQRYDMYNETGQAGIVNASMAEHFYSGEPIWLSNERAGNARRSAAINWPGGAAFWPSPPHRPSFFKSWIENVHLRGWKADFDQIIKLFTRPVDPYNFVAWYISEPDLTLHANGFRNGEIEKTLKLLDALMGYVVETMHNQSELAQRLNIILTSDHGHAQIESPSNVFCLSEFISLDGLQIGDNMLTVSDQNRKIPIYEQLKNAIEQGHYGINLYLKENFPRKYGYAYNKRVGDIIIEPKPGFFVQTRCTRKEYEQLYSKPGSFHKSAHGMDPNHWTMKAMLVMNGPSFKHQHQIDKTASNIDIYAVMCHLLDVLPAPNNGTLNNLLDALDVRPLSHAPALPEKLITLIVCATCGGLLLIFLIFAILACRNNGTTFAELLLAGSAAATQMPRYQRLPAEKPDEKAGGRYASSIDDDRRQAPSSAQCRRLSYDDRL